MRIDTDTRQQIDDMASQQPGDVNYGIDGVQVLGENHQLVTKNVGRVTAFVKLLQLGSEVHVTEAEIQAVEDAIIDDMTSTPGKKVSSVAVDNAAGAMAAGLAAKLAQSADARKVLVVRDASHCIDLGPKDLAFAGCIQPVMEEANELVKFLSKDRIKGIADEMFASGTVRALAVHAWPDTRMYLVADTAVKLASWRVLLSTLPMNHKYHEYLGTRTASKCARARLFVLV
jgi:hypothetical protein